MTAPLVAPNSDISNAVDEEVIKTAKDSLCAKMSALTYGNYEVPISCNIPGENGDITTSYRLIYRTLLQNMYMGIMNTDINPRSSAKLKFSPPQQTPLVNAGYFIRMSTITTIIERFLIKNISSSSVQILILGAGLDTVGLWALSLAQGMGLVDSKLYELDCTAICNLKRKVLVEQPQQWNLNIIDGQCENETTGRNRSIVLQGYHYSDKDKNMKDPKTTASNYTIAETNLKTVSCVQSTLEQLSGFNLNAPTLVLSELVMCYLDVDSTDSLLAMIQSTLFRDTSSTSVFLSYEPMGSITNQSNTTSVSSSIQLQSFHEQYFTLFTKKLNANSNIPCALSDSNTKNYRGVPFHPLGNSCKDIMKRLHNYGFECPKSFMPLNLLHQVEINTGKGFIISEPFDEHAALLYHLRSYAITCGFSTMVDIDFARDIMFGISSSSTFSSGIYIIQPICKTMEENAITLFQEAYESYFTQYPSVRKLVKASLKRDMKISSSNSSISSIRESYKQLGGDFWVATIPSSEEGQQQINTSCIGLIGLCRITSNDGAPFILKTGETAVATFEIKRLVVNAEYRKLGVGKSLLLKTIQYIKYHLYSHESLFSQPEQKLVARLIAVTPTIMEAANQFYLACGFELLEEKETHKMSFKTYSKDILII